MSEYKQPYKTVDFKSLKTRRLMAYFKAERQRFLQCLYYYESLEFTSWESYVDEIRTELGTREHLEKR